MPKRPLLPIHILYDHQVVGEDLLLEQLCSLAVQLAKNPVTADAVRLNVIRIGAQMDAPCEPEMLELKLRRGMSMLLDLNGAFQQALADYQHLDHTMQGYANAEILLLLGDQPKNNWVSGWKELEPFRVLILTYYFSKQALESYEVADIERLLRQISPPDPESSAPRSKLVRLAGEADLTAQLQGVFARLKERIEARGRKVGQVSIGLDK